jgi:uncharacterized membrane protein YjfL (UPF0719 family)
MCTDFVSAWQEIADDRCRTGTDIEGCIIALFEVGGKVGGVAFMNSNAEPSAPLGMIVKWGLNRHVILTFVNLFTQNTATNFETMNNNKQSAVGIWNKIFCSRLGGPS